MLKDRDKGLSPHCQSFLEFEPCAHLLMQPYCKFSIDGCIGGSAPCSQMREFIRATYSKFNNEECEYDMQMLLVSCVYRAESSLELIHV